MSLTDDRDDTPGPLCTCPDTHRLGNTRGVVHQHRVHCDEPGCGAWETYVWVFDGKHMCGRCRWGWVDE